MNINLHIERLILEGLAVSRAELGHVQKGVELELTRLLAQGGIRKELLTGSALPSLTGGTIGSDPSMRGSELGMAIAKAVYVSLGNISGSGSKHIGQLTEHKQVDTQRIPKSREQ
jgi:hypothetical protein